MLKNKFFISAVCVIAIIASIGAFFFFSSPFSRHLSQGPSSTQKISSQVEIPAGLEVLKYSSQSPCYEEMSGQKTAAVIGDFDGDGISDQVMYLRKIDDSALFLYAWLSTNKFRPEVLDSITGGPFTNSFLSTISKGEKIKSACARGYSEFCKGDEPSEFALPTDAILTIYCESASSILVWDPQTKSFQTTVLSD